MDPLTALGLAGNVVQFVDFSSKLLGGAYEVYSSASGATAETADLGTVITDLQAVTRRLSPPSIKPRTDDEIALTGLVSNCRKLSGDIQKVLNKLQSKDQHQKWASLRIAWASMRKKEKLASLETRLNRYRSEILIRISIMMKEEQSSIRTALEKISQHDETSAKQTREELGRLKQDILQGVELLLQSYNRNDDRSSLEQPAKTLTDIRIALSGVAETTNTIAKEDWVLKKLKFDSMYSREDSIEDAHSKTFRWLLQDPKKSSSSIGSHPSETISIKSTSAKGTDSKLEHFQGPSVGNDTEQNLGSEHYHESSSLQHSEQGDNPNLESQRDTAHESETISLSEEAPEPELRQNARSSFIEWLRCGSGIFYISGKAGSGKSTLMKFLVQQRRTRDELAVWAGDKKLVFAQFFFWNSGTEMQKSLEGLYRSILFETLRECPDLIREVFPESWKRASSLKDLISGEQAFRPPEILAAFNALMKNANLFSSHKFCFFIDGLDEYVGDHWKMAKSLKRWTASQDIKICVSCRPHNEFEESFSCQPNLRLRLHELTKRDMEKFVNDEFEDDERFLRVQNDDERYLKLKEKIVELADGVFLWVRLATHSLLSGLGNNFSILELEQKLETMPSGLSEFFRKMWDSIDYSDRARAARIFSVATYDNVSDDNRMNMLVYSFLDDLDDKEDFTDEIHTGKIRAITEDEMQERLQKTRQRLAGRCKGLLEITELRGKELFFKYQVNFLHRTVREFLVQDEMQEELNRRCGNFDKLGSILLACLAIVKFIPMEPPLITKFDCFDLVDDLLHLAVRSEAEGSIPRLRELQTLYDILNAHQDTLTSGTKDTDRNFVRILWEIKDNLGFSQTYSEIGAYDFSLINYAAYVGLYSFVSEMISLSPYLLEFRKGRNLLVSASLGALVLESYQLLSVKLTKFLLEHGASPNEPLPGLLYIHREVLKGPVETPWALFLLGSITSVHKSGLPKDRCQILEVIELFLRNGADASICLLGYQVQDVEGKLIVVDGPSYMTLEQLVEIWAPINADIIRELLRRNSPTRSKDWLNWVMVPFQRAQRTATTPKRHIKPLEFNKIQDSYFSVTSVGSITTLDKLTLSEIQFAAAIIQHENSGIMELERSRDLGIRVS